MTINHKIMVIVIGLLLLVVFVLPSQGQSGIVVTDADTLRTETVEASTGLDNEIVGVLERVVVNAVNTVRPLQLAIVPPELQAKLDLIANRILLQAVNSSREIRLTIVPDGLQSKLAAVAGRFTIQAANTNRQISLRPPIRFIDGTAPTSVTLDQAMGSNNNANGHIIAFAIVLLGVTIPYIKKQSLWEKFEG